MHATRRLDLIHNAIRFHQDIPYGYLVPYGNIVKACIRIV